MRVLFLNENIGGHATVAHNLRAAMRAVPDVEASFLDVPHRRGWRRVVGASIPGLAALDLDLQPLREQLAVSAVAHRQLRAAIDSVRPDVVHVYTQNAALLSVGLARRVPTVVTTDSTNALNAFRLPTRAPTRFTGRASKPSQRLERRVFDAAGAVVANTAWVAHSLRETYGVADSKIHVIPFGVTIPDVPASLPTGERPRITFVGRTLARKGGLELLDLHQRRLADRCDLVLVTKEEVSGPHRAVTVIDDLEPGDGRLWDVLRDTSVFVLPSRIDQAPNSVIEAMAAGVPVVACRAGGLHEIVEDGVTGVLVDPSDDGDGLAKAIEGLLADPARLAAMGAAGRARAQERFDMRDAARALAAVFADVQR